jgi:hypothetical protein
VGEALASAFVTTSPGLYVVECYTPGIDRSAVESAGKRAAAAAAELRRAGVRIEYAGAYLVPGDEVVFHLFCSESPDVVRDASVRARVEFERVLESIPVGIEVRSVEATGRGRR